MALWSSNDLQVICMSLVSLQKWLQSVMRTGILNTHKRNTWKWHIAAKKIGLRYATKSAMRQK